MQPIITSRPLARLIATLPAAVSCKMGFVTTTLTGGESGGETIASLVAAEPHCRHQRWLSLRALRQFGQDRTCYRRLRQAPIATNNSISTATSLGSGGTMSGTTYVALVPPGTDCQYQ